MHHIDIHKLRVRQTRGYEITVGLGATWMNAGSGEKYSMHIDARYVIELIESKSIEK